MLVTLTNENCVETAEWLRGLGIDAHCRDYALYFENWRLDEEQEWRLQPFAAIPGFDVVVVTDLVSIGTLVLLYAPTGLENTFWKGVTRGDAEISS